MNLLSLIFPQTVYKTSSKFSGEIKVIDHAFERRLVVGGLTQSGGITKEMWERALRELEVRSEKLEVRSVLILGLGAGTVAEVINKKWPDAKIIGVEIDSAIVDAGKRYFGLNNRKNLEIIIGDANTFDTKQKFNLIIVDLYKGIFIEKNIQNELFLQKIAQKMEKNSLVIFNVLSGQNTNFEAKIFLDKLQRMFKDYFCKRIIVNDFYFCGPVLRD